MVNSVLRLLRLQELSTVQTWTRSGKKKFTSCFELGAAPLLTDLSVEKSILLDGVKEAVPWSG